MPVPNTCLLRRRAYILLQYCNLDMGVIGPIRWPSEESARQKVTGGPLDRTGIDLAGGGIKDKWRG
jgi:hypothetical protein